MDETLSPLQRLFLAFVAFFAVLFDRRFAQGVHLLRERERGALPEPPPRVLTPEQRVELSAELPPEPPPEPFPATPPPPPSPVPIPIPPQAAAAAESVPAFPSRPPAPDHAEALRVLALLQRDGRLIDFVSESLEGFGDADIGAAARTVHAGCRKVLDSYLTLEPIFREPEEARVTVSEGFDAAAVRLTGAVAGSPPFQGSLKHHGWRVVSARFPPPVEGQDPRILAPAEVEL